MVWIWGFSFWPNESSTLTNWRGENTDTQRQSYHRFFALRREKRPSGISRPPLQTTRGVLGRTPIGTPLMSIRAISLQYASEITPTRVRAELSIFWQPISSLSLSKPIYLDVSHHAPYPFAEVSLVNASTSLLEAVWWTHRAHHVRQHGNTGHHSPDISDWRICLPSYLPFRSDSPRGRCGGTVGYPLQGSRCSNHLG